MSLNILHEDGVSVVDITAATAEDLARAIGWELKAEGLCRGSVCIPVRELAVLRGDALSSLRAIATALNRSIVVDEEAHVAAISGDRVAIESNVANRRSADFTLHSLDGEPFTLSSIGRKKKLLVAWASW